MTRKRTSSTRDDTGTPEAFTYTNRKGVTYYLHEGRTKSGKPRYFFARSVGDGSLAELPTGYEVAESINGVVSVRRRREGEIAIPDEDLALVRAELGRHAHLRHHVALAVLDAIVIHQPDVDLADLRDSADSFRLLAGQAEAFMADRIWSSRCSRSRASSPSLAPRTRASGPRPRSIACASNSCSRGSTPRVSSAQASTR